MTWAASTAYHAIVQSRTYVVGTPGPGLGWVSVLDEVVRRHYTVSGATQARWTRAVRHVLQKSKSPVWITVLVETTRSEVLEVRLAPAADAVKRKDR